jgi:hypothetical protein
MSGSRDTGGSNQPGAQQDAEYTVSTSGDGIIGQNEDADIGSLIRAALLSTSNSDACATPIDGNPGDFSADHAAYDGHIPLSLDTDILPAINTTLDLLTTSVDLFDVPSFDFGASPDAGGDV